MRKLLPILLLSLVALPLFSQEKPAAPSQDQGNPFSTFNKHAYARIKGILLSSAEKMPEENYSFKPADTVRSYGQIIGHLGDAQYLFCSKALDEKGPQLNIEKTKTTKADLITALKEGFAYCDKAYDGMTDVSGAQTVDLFGGPTPKLSVLSVNLIHNMEHYGNLVTYMRIKGLVPPTSEQPPPKPAENPPQPKK